LEIISDKDEYTMQEITTAVGSQVFKRMFIPGTKYDYDFILIVNKLNEKAKKVADGKKKSKKKRSKRKFRK
jgi:hypothetical protein